MKEKRVITKIEQLTPEWLTSIFKNKGYLSQGRVTKIIKKNKIDGKNSNIHFLEIIFSNDAQTEPTPPKVVVRIPKTNRPSTTPFNRKSLQDVMGKHEAKFYTIVAEMMKEIPIPPCYDAAYSEETGLSHIILRDLSDTHSEYLNELPSAIKLQYVYKSIDWLAEFHAFWWDHPKLKELSNYSFMFYTFKENSFNEKEILNWFENEKQMLNRMLKILGDQISDTRKELFKTVFSKYPKLAYERMKQKNITVIHGDAHHWNFFFPKDMEKEKSKTILNDWENWSIGTGCQDLSFMLGYCWPPEPRRALEKELIKRYHNNLINLGVKNFSWDECWYDYRFSAFLNLYKVVSKWGYEYLPSDWWATLESSFFTIEDLNCIELLGSKE